METKGKTRRPKDFLPPQYKKKIVNSFCIFSQTQISEKSQGMINLEGLLFLISIHSSSYAIIQKLLKYTWDGW